MFELTPFGRRSHDLFRDFENTFLAMISGRPVLSVPISKIKAINTFWRPIYQGSKKRISKLTLTTTI